MRKGTCQEVSEAHTNAPHFHVCTLSAKRAYKLRTVSQPAVMSVSSPNSEFLVAALLSLHLSQKQPAPLPRPTSFHAWVSPKTLPNVFCFFFSRTPLALTRFRKHAQRTRRGGYALAKCDIFFFFFVIGYSHQSHAYIQHSPTQGAVLRVKRQDADGSHLVCADGLL